MYAELLLLTALIQGCATPNSGSFEHGIAIENPGKGPVYDIVIFYGQRKIEFSGRTPHNPAGGGLWNAGMPVPSEMTVIWRTEKNGRDHRTTIPLKDKTSFINRLANWKILFFEERIELWREDNTGPLNPYTMIWPREVKKVFP
jgi:hypothetical protein